MWSQPAPHWLTPEECESGRRESMDEMIVPIVQREFVARPSLHSAAVMVAQYWNDNADDEVHVSIVWSRFETPRFGQWNAGDEFGGEERSSVAHSDADVTDGGYVDFELAYGYLDEPGGRDPLIKRFEPFGAHISLLAAYCPEAADQDGERVDNYAQYAVVRRSSDSELDVEIVGEQPRPWLDGVPSGTIRCDRYGQILRGVVGSLQRDGLLPDLWPASLTDEAMEAASQENARRTALGPQPFDGQTSFSDRGFNLDRLRALFEAVRNAAPMPGDSEFDRLCSRLVDEHEVDLALQQTLLATKTRASDGSFDGPTRSDSLVGWTPWSTRVSGDLSALQVWIDENVRRRQPPQY